MTTKTSRRATGQTTPIERSSAVDLQQAIEEPAPPCAAPVASLTPGRTSRDIRGVAAGGNLQQAISLPSPVDDAPAVPSAPANIEATSERSAPGSTSARAVVAASPKVESPALDNLASGQRLGATHRRSAAGNPFPVDQWSGDNRSGTVDRQLLVYAESLDDLERTRIAFENRARSIPDAGDQFANIAQALGKIEHEATLNLQRAMRKHPYAAWVKNTVGVGEKQGARLLAAIGDPTWNAADNRPRRGPAELWAYCGYAPGQQRRKGVKSNWNANAKMRAYLVAVSCMKSPQSPYRDVYLQERLKWDGREGVTKGHAHNHALRVVAKSVLRDLWRFGNGLPPRGRAAA